MKMVKLLAAAGIVMAICFDAHAEKITPFMFSIYPKKYLQMPDSDYSVYGLHLAPGIGFAKNVTGVQIGGIFAYAINSVGGVQVGGVAGAEEISGLQVGGLFAYTEETLGIQIAGLMAASKEMSGIQVGFSSLAKEVTFGVQLGVINKAEMRGGIQIGPVNIADAKAGIQIGFVNYANKQSDNCIQIGFVNWLGANDTLKALPFFNCRF